MIPVRSPGNNSGDFTIALLAGFVTWSSVRMRLAIIGDFTNIKSKAPRNFIHESNTRGVVNFVGTVYPAIRIIADWGILQVNEGGCLFDWKKAIVSGKSIKQTDRKITGEGWEIELAGGWKLVHEGMNYRLKQEN